MILIYYSEYQQLSMYGLISVRVLTVQFSGSNVLVSLVVHFKMARLVFQQNMMQALRTCMLVVIKVCVIHTRGIN